MPEKPKVAIRAVWPWPLHRIRAKHRVAPSTACRLVSPQQKRPQCNPTPKQMDVFAVPKLVKLKDLNI